MREHLVGRTPRLTAYFCGITLGLAFLVAGIEAIRIRFLGDIGGPILYGVIALGVIGGFLLAFVAGYLNGGILASWTAGFVPVAARVGPDVADGTLRDIAVTTMGSFGLGVLLGTIGFVVAVEKHRYDSRTAELPEPPTRFALLKLVTLAVFFGTTLVTLGLYL